MKNKYFKLIIIAVIGSFISCKSNYNNSIIASIKYIKKDSCEWYCNNVEMYIKNNTNEKLYIWRFRVGYYNKLHFPILYNQSSRLYYKYDRKAKLNNQKFEFFNSPCESDNQNIFFDDAIKQELKIFCDYNNLDSTDSVVLNKNKFWVEARYKRIFVILEPNEECKVDVLSIDALLNKYRKLKIKRWYDLKKNDKGKDFKTTLSDGRTAKLQHYFLPEVAGYKLFTGKVKSNTLVFKNGKLIKDKPARGHRKKKQNK